MNLPPSIEADLDAWIALADQRVDHRNTVIAPMMECYGLRPSFVLRGVSDAAPRPHPKPTLSPRQTAREIFAEGDWLTIRQAAARLGCSTDLIRKMITGGQFGKAGTVSNDNPLRDLTPAGLYRTWRIHRSRFTEIAPSQCDSRLVKAPSVRINTKAHRHLNDDFLEGFDKWSVDFAKKNKRGRG